MGGSPTGVWFDVWRVVCYVRGRVPMIAATSWPWRGRVVAAQVWPCVCQAVAVVGALWRRGVAAVAVAPGRRLGRGGRVAFFVSLCGGCDTPREWRCSAVSAWCCLS